MLLTAGANVNDSAPAGDPNEPITIGFASKKVPAFAPDDLTAVRTSALVLAMLNGHFALATWLVNHGAYPNAPDPRGSALHALAWLRKAGLPLDSGPVRVTFGDPETFTLAQALLEHGANPNARIAWKEIVFDKVGGQVRLPPNVRMGRNWLSYVGATPFWLAAKSSDVPLMRLLLAHHADPLLPAVQNATPLLVAAGLGFWDAESPAPQNGTPESDTLEAVRICVERGADVNETTKYGVIRVHGDPRELRARYLFPDELPADGTVLRRHALGTSDCAARRRAAWRQHGGEVPRRQGRQARRAHVTRLDAADGGRSRLCLQRRAQLARDGSLSPRPHERSVACPSMTHPRHPTRRRLGMPDSLVLVACDQRRRP